MTSDDWLDYCAAVVWNEHLARTSTTFGSFQDWIVPLRIRFPVFSGVTTQEMREAHNRIEGTGKPSGSGVTKQRRGYAVPELGDALAGTKPALYLDWFLSQELMP